MSEDDFLEAAYEDRNGSFDENPDEEPDVCPYCGLSGDPSDHVCEYEDDDEDDV